MPKTETILTFCAHNDDQTIGAGGTIKKHILEGGKAHTIIFSYGESSHPHLKPEVIAKTREKESLRAAKVLGDSIEYFGLKEGNFEKECDIKKIKAVIRKIKPTKIFTHSPDDPHPDHRAVFRIVTKALKEMNYKRDVYAFNVWNPFSLKTRSYPKMYVDISETFKYKVQALGKHKSQFNAIVLLGWSLYTKGILNGLAHHCKYAELFYKLEL